MTDKYTYESDFSFPLAGTREEIFDALSDPAALGQWFAEHVEIGSTVGSSFRFWGRYSYGASTREDATQSLLHLRRPDALSFSWRFLDRDSEVTWSLGEAPDDPTATKLSIRHEFSALPEVTRAEALIDDMWRIHSGNLCLYLNGRREFYRPDFADGSPEVRLDIEIDAPPEKVFAALIVPENIQRWFPAPAPVVDPRVGGDYGFGFSFEVDGRTVEPPPMKILEFVENERLTITWPDWRMNPGVPDQHVTWRLEDLGGRTRLTLIHAGFTRAVDVSDYPFGWQQFLDKIGEVAETL